ncbi:hypothetical protein WUBG_17450 [Wuchereria bancrofti]|uniref:Uncharacterized protein n=1 Tax=Wuchereria bancrofti TaxID=6293 RepID=J9DPT2_WUCBA|nr:hypothetical protein WUBG_17450 [Wuchereria bancrofti]
MSVSLCDENDRLLLTSNKKKKTVKNQLAHQEIFENSEVEISNYHSAGISASATHTPSEVSVEKEGGNVNLKLSNDIAEKRSKNKTEKFSLRLLLINKKLLVSNIF